MLNNICVMCSTLFLLFMAIKKDIRCLIVCFKGTEFLPQTLINFLISIFDGVNH